MNSSPSAIFLWCCVAGGMGIVFSFVSSVLSQYAFFFLGGSIFLIVLGYVRKFILVAGLVLLCFSLGLLRTASISEEQSGLLALNDTEVQLQGMVTEEVRTTESNTQITFQPDSIERGRVLIFAERNSDIRFGDLIVMEGELATPPEFEDFSYKEYLAQQDIYSVAYQPSVEIVEREKYETIFSWFQGTLFSAKESFRHIAVRNLPSFQAEILGAITMGDKHILSDGVKEDLNRAGVRHITAISGMHVTIVTALLMAFLIQIGLWRQQAFWGALALMILFIVFTGLQPSAMRAGLMGGVLLFGQYIGRLGVSFRALVYAALIMLLINPQIISDVGFQLSFLAVLGIILLNTPISRIVSFVPEKLALRSMLSMTLSAQVFTFPVLITSFGYISVVSPLANILIVPLLPFILVFGFLFLFAGLTSSFLAFIVSLPLQVMLGYLLFVVEMFSSLSFSVFEIQYIWPGWLLLFYSLLFLYLHYRRTTRQFLPYE